MNKSIKPAEANNLERCALCHRARPLCESHIIPELAFRPLYDAKHRFVELSTDEAVRNRFRQKGLREKLLCQEDETRLSRWENYAKKALHGGTELSVTQDGPFLKTLDNEMKKQYLNYRVYHMREI